MADTAEDVRELAGAWVDDDPKLYRFLSNYAALLEAQPELLRRLRAAEALLQSIIEAYDANSGAEPSVSVLDRAIDAARRKP